MQDGRQDTGERGSVGKSAAKIHTLLAYIGAWLHETFPERQIYIRSEGQVQFFSLGPLLQATLASCTVLFLGWVAFSSVNVIFKDRIISAKEKRFHQMQAAYEDRVSGLQLSYDEVNSALVASQDRFRATAGELQAKQNAILRFLGRKQQVDSALAASATNVLSTGDNKAQNKPVSQPVNLDSDNYVLPEPPKQTPQKTRKASFLNWGAVDRWAGAVFGRSHKQALTPQIVARHPALRQLAAQTESVRRIGVEETQLMVLAQGEAASGVRQIDSLLRRAGVNAEQYIARVDAKRGMGGPEIPLDPERAPGVSDPAFQNAYGKAYDTLDQLNHYLAGFYHIPLTTPVVGGQFENSSPFGARTDPITGRHAFHPGIDFAGPYGSLVRATAPGVVSGAGMNGAYGNMVEINHGYGIRTKYGHLAAILVHVGSRVEKGSPIGKLGSTGRSTGPHVHYEVWYDGSLRNPRNFIEAGRYVLKQG